MSKIKLIPEEIKDYLSYDELSGNLIWIKRPSRNVNLGDIAGCQDTYGYIIIRFIGYGYKAQRIIWFLKTGKQPPEFIDHINEIKTDNMWDNLREATNQSNQQNRGKNRNNSSGYKGVTWHKATGKWKAQISIDHKRVTLGYFTDPKEAYETYCKLAEQLHGDFANFG